MVYLSTICGYASRTSQPNNRNYLSLQNNSGLPTLLDEYFTTGKISSWSIELKYSARRK